MSSAAEPAVDVRRAADRFVTRQPGLDSRHSFSFGRHYDPANTSHALLLANNAHVVQPGAGFAAHPHRDLEIVTWVLRGSFVHEDSTGQRGEIHPGLAQRMSAGTGILHSERSRSGAQPVHLVQMWVAPDRTGGTPSYEQADVEDELQQAGLVTIASGRAHEGAALRLGNRFAAVHAARLRPTQSVVLPDAPYVHVFVPLGAVHVEAVGPLGTGDAARLTAAGGRRVTATGAAEILVCEMHAALAP